jgi:hypothetical protein
MLSRKEFILVTAIVILITYTSTLLLVMQVFPAGQTTYSLASSGSIKATEGIGVYSNLACTEPQTTIQWGELEKGGSANVIIYVKNEGDSLLTLSLVTSDWSPTSVADYLTISWNYNSQPLNPDSVVQITLTISVEPDAPTIPNFGVNLLIVGNT